MPESKEREDYYDWKKEYHKQNRSKSCVFYCAVHKGHPSMIIPGHQTDVDPSTLKMKGSDVLLEENQQDPNKISFLS